MKAITLTLLSATYVLALIDYQRLDESFTPIDDYHLGHRLIMIITPNVDIISRQIKRLNSSIELSPFISLYETTRKLYQKTRLQ